MSTLKVEIKCLYFTMFFTGWYLILRFVWNNFSTKISKSGHSVLAKNRKILQHEKKSHVCAAIGQFGHITVSQD